MGLDGFLVEPSRYDERLDESRDVREVAKELALGKALEVASRFPEAYVIGSDTIVALGNRQMAKPANRDVAREMLTSLSGRESTVSTGVAVVNVSKGIQLVDVDTTNVYFKADNDDLKGLREGYLDSGDWTDKAGGYGIQSGAAPLIESIEGDFDTIVGLPTRLLAQMLGELGIMAQAVLEEPPMRRR